MRSMTLVLALLALAAAQEAGERSPYKTSYRVINVHAHFDFPVEAALKAELEVMDRVGVAAAVNLDVGRSGESLPAWLALQKKYPGRFVLFGKFTLKDFARAGEPAFFDDL